MTDGRSLPWTSALRRAVGGGLTTPSDGWERVDHVEELAHDLAVLRADVAISVAWGRQHMNGESWSHEPWSHVFPDRDIRGFYVDVRWHGQPVHGDLVLSVDGGRAYLPSGAPIVEEDKGIVGMRVTRREVALARLVDELSQGHSEFDSYLAKANVQIRT